LRQTSRNPHRMHTEPTIPRDTFPFVLFSYLLKYLPVMFAQRLAGGENIEAWFKSA
jgi:hypothetical protein